MSLQLTLHGVLDIASYGQNGKSLKLITDENESIGRVFMQFIENSETNLKADIRTCDVGTDTSEISESTPCGVQNPGMSSSFVTEPEETGQHPNHNEQVKLNMPQANIKTGNLSFEPAPRLEHAKIPSTGDARKKRTSSNFCETETSISSKILLLDGPPSLRTRSTVSHHLKMETNSTKLIGEPEQLLPVSTSADAFSKSENSKILPQTVAIVKKTDSNLATALSLNSIADDSIVQNVPFTANSKNHLQLSGYKSENVIESTCNKRLFDTPSVNPVQSPVSTTGTRSIESRPQAIEESKLNCSKCNQTLNELQRKHHHCYFSIHVCTDCSLTFEGEISLAQHRLICNTQRKPQKASQDLCSSRKMSRNFDLHCEKCSEAFDSPSAYIRHKRGRLCIPDQTDHFVDKVNSSLSEMDSTESDACTQKTSPDSNHISDSHRILTQTRDPVDFSNVISDASLSSSSVVINERVLIDRSKEFVTIESFCIFSNNGFSGQNFEKSLIISNSSDSVFSDNKIDIPSAECFAGGIEEHPGHNNESLINISVDQHNNSNEYPTLTAQYRDISLDSSFESYEILQAVGLKKKVPKEFEDSDYSPRIGTTSQSCPNEPPAKRGRGRPPKNSYHRPPNQVNKLSKHENTNTFETEQSRASLNDIQPPSNSSVFSEVKKLTRSGKEYENYCTEIESSPPSCSFDASALPRKVTTTMPQSPIVLQALVSPATDIAKIEDAESLVVGIEHIQACSLGTSDNNRSFGELNGLRGTASRLLAKRHGLKNCSSDFQRAPVFSKYYSKRKHQDITSESLNETSIPKEPTTDNSQLKDHHFRSLFHSSTPTEITSSENTKPACCKKRVAKNRRNKSKSLVNKNAMVCAKMSPTNFTKTKTVPLDSEAVATVRLNLSVGADSSIAFAENEILPTSSLHEAAVEYSARQQVEAPCVKHELNRDAITIAEKTAENSYILMSNGQTCFETKVPRLEHFQANSSNNTMAEPHGICDRKSDYDFVHDLHRVYELSDTKPNTNREPAFCPVAYCADIVEDIFQSVFTLALGRGTREDLVDFADVMPGLTKDHFNVVQSLIDQPCSGTAVFPIELLSDSANIGHSVCNLIISEPDNQEGADTVSDRVVPVTITERVEERIPNIDTSFKFSSNHSNSISPQFDSPSAAELQTNTADNTDDKESLSFLESMPFDMMPGFGGSPNISQIELISVAPVAECVDETSFLQFDESFACSTPNKSMYDDTTLPHSDQTNVQSKSLLLTEKSFLRAITSCENVSDAADARVVDQIAANMKKLAAEPSNGLTSFGVRRDSSQTSSSKEAGRDCGFVDYERGNKSDFSITQLTELSSFDLTSVNTSLIRNNFNDFQFDPLLQLSSDDFEE